MLIAPIGQGKIAAMMVGESDRIPLIFLLCFFSFSHLNLHLFFIPA